jgi:hypothetical protein
MEFTYCALFIIRERLWSKAPETLDLSAPAPISLWLRLVSIYVSVAGDPGRTDWFPKGLLASNLSAFCVAKCSEPLDNVYGLLGLIEPALNSKVDYNIDLSTLFSYALWQCLEQGVAYSRLDELKVQQMLGSATGLEPHEYCYGLGTLARLPFISIAEARDGKHASVSVVVEEAVYTKLAAEFGKSPVPVVLT